MTLPVLAWHFTGAKLRDGRSIPAPGTELRHDGEITWCESGLYASRRLIDALGNALGATIHRVECREIEREESGKLVCRSRTILWSLDATTLLRRFACDEALCVAHLWKMPATVRRYLKTMDDALRIEAWTARPGLRPTLRPGPQPVLRPGLRPVLRPVLRPTLRSVLQPVLRPGPRPIRASPPPSKLLTKRRQPHDPHLHH